jgi:recombination protein RecA
MKFIEKLKKEFGEAVFTSSTEVTSVIPTDSLALDISTGVGGIPVGRFITIYGPEGCGKTTLAVAIAKNVVDGGGKVLYIDVEQTLYDPLVENIIGEHILGNQFIPARPETAEQAFRIAEASIESGEFDLIVYDSVGAMSPEKELDGDFGDSHYALVARLCSQFLRRNAFKVRVKGCTFIFINQVRDKMDAGPFKTYTQPGGHALKHYASMVLKLFKSKKIDGKEKKEYRGVRIKFFVEKNKVGPPYREFTFPIVWNVGIDTTLDTIEFASMLGVITTRGPYKVFEDETLGLGLAKTVDLLNSDTDKLDKIKEMCYNTVGVKPLPRFYVEGKNEEVVED